VEAFLDVSFRLKSKMPWADAGHEVAWEQFPFPVAAAPAVAPKRKPVKLEQTPGAITVRGEGFVAGFDPGTGFLVSLKNGDAELLDAPLRPHFWRAPVDNDRGNKMPSKLGVWRNAHETWKSSKVEAGALPAGGVRVLAEGVLATGSGRLAWTVDGGGEVAVAFDFTPAEGVPELPRFGMQTTLRAGFERLTWYGKGPHETYSDRQAARVGIYEGSVKAQFVRYAKPQETGNHEATRWIALRDAQGRGLMAVGDPLLSANALHPTTEDLFCATQKENYYPYQLPERATVTLNLDLRQRGVGGDDSWGALPHEPFRIMPKPMSYRYKLKLIRGEENLAAFARGTR
jgi:beta-galactosidase